MHDPSPLQCGANDGGMKVGAGTDLLCWCDIMALDSLCAARFDDVSGREVCRNVSVAGVDLLISCDGQNSLCVD